jgi:2-methylisocitrate lyase-like PEP mutase family enzyme
LPNAWDVPSALAYLADGFTAIGTTSFGVASSVGHRDGGRAIRSANIALAAEVAAIKRRNPEAFVNARGRHLLAAPRCRHRHHDRTSPSLCRGRRRPHLCAGGERSRRDRRTHPQYPTPLNTLPVPGLTLTHLGELGVARVSTGSAPYRAASYAAAQLVRAVRDGQPLPPSTPYDALQRRLIGYENHTGTT